MSKAYDKYPLREIINITASVSVADSHSLSLSVAVMERAGALSLQIGERGRSLYSGESGGGSLYNGERGRSLYNGESGGALSTVERAGALSLQ
jgi:hypothetical protein